MTEFFLPDPDFDFEKVNTDPDAFVAYYRENVLRKDMFSVIDESMERWDMVRQYYMCINPSCHFVKWHEEGGRRTIMRKCDACGCFTSLFHDLADKIPDSVILGLSHVTMESLVEQKESQKGLWNAGATDEKVYIKVIESWPTLCMNTSIPQLSVKGDHFIRGRVNREVLNEAGLAIYNDELLQLRLGPTRFNLGNLIGRMLDDPLCMLDPERADKFRDEYVDSRWQEEYIQFVSTLRDKDLLRVDSAGLNETLTALYHMAQKRAGKRTIIKKDGSIVFPTQDVLENMKPLMFERAFHATEHGSYDSPGAVFNMAT